MYVLISCIDISSSVVVQLTDGNRTILFFVAPHAQRSNLTTSPAVNINQISGTREGRFRHHVDVTTLMQRRISFILNLLLIKISLTY